MSRLSTRRAIGAALLASAALPAGTLKAVLRREAIPGPIPAGISENVRGAIAEEGQRVFNDGVPLADFWLRRSLPRSAVDGRSSPVLGERANFNHLPSGLLVGFVRFNAAWRDYRDREIPAGLYAMRYALQPAIKEHRGVSAYRDFLVLTPAERDASLERRLAEVLAESVAYFGRGHPAVLALFPAPNQRELPSIARNELGEAMLAVRVGEETFGIVFSGAGTKPRD